MKKIVIADDGQWGKLPWSSMKLYNTKHLREAYAYLFKKAEKYELKFYKSNFKWRKNGKFVKGWEYSDGWKQAFNIKEDFVMDKSSFSEHNNKWKKIFDKQNKILNHFFIEDLCTDKMKTYRLYPELVPKCFLVNDRKELDRVIKKIRSSKVVLKPIAGSSAKGLKIVDRDNIPKIKKGTIVQEFVDASCGLKGLVKGIYDLRCVVINGEIVDSFIRQAAPGNLTSNYSTGGKLVFYSLDKIPIPVRNAVKKIDAKLKKYVPRIYTADFVIDCNDRLWLIEMNSKPGFFFYEAHGQFDARERFENSLVRAIKQVV